MLFIDISVLQYFLAQQNMEFPKEGTHIYEYFYYWVGLYNLYCSL